MVSSPNTSWQIERGKVEAVTYFILGGSKITAEGHSSHEIKRHLLLGRKAMRNLDNILKSRDMTNKGKYSQTYGFSSSHIWIWELDQKEGWVLKNWYFQTVVLLKTLESPLDSKETKAVNPQRNQPWIFIGRSDAEALIIWPAIMKSQHVAKDPKAGNIEGKRRRGQLRIRWWDSITDSRDMNLSKLWEIVEDRGVWHTAVYGDAKCQISLSN